MSHQQRTKGSPRRRPTLRAAALAAAGAVFASAAPAAAGGPLEHESFHDTGSELWVDFCGDLDVVHSWDVSGSLLGVARGPDGLVYYRDSVRGTDTFTNTVTGKSYTNVWTANSRDLKITDNGDGTLTIVEQASGGSRYYDGDGNLVLLDPGMFRYEILVDDAGTPTDPFDDQFVEFLGTVKGSTGRNDIEGRDFCTDVLLFTS